MAYPLYIVKVPDGYFCQCLCKATLGGYKTANVKINIKFLNKMAEKGQNMCNAIVFAVKTCTIAWFTSKISIKNGKSKIKK